MPSIDAFLSPSALWNPVHVISDCSRGMAVVVCVAGIVTNTIVIVTFARMRLRDSVTVSFFSIAIADLLCVTSGLAYNLRYFVHSYWCFYYDGLCDSFKLAISSIVLICSSGVLVKVVVYLTVFLALQMCLCVASPRRFKVVFNRRTTSAVMLTIWALSSTVLGLNLYLEWRCVDIYYEFDQQSYKSTRDGKATLLHDVEVIAGDCLMPVCYVTVAICASFMLYRLRQSVRLGLRKVNLNTAAGKDVNTHGSFNVIDHKHWDIDIEACSSVTSSNYKERRLIMQVALLLGVFLITNIPNTLNSFYNLPGLRKFWVFTLAHFDIGEVGSLLLFLNSTLKLLIYNKYNKKFRHLGFKRRA